MAEVEAGEAEAAGCLEVVAFVIVVGVAKPTSAKESLHQSDSSP